MTKHYVEHGIPLIRNSDIKENRFEFKKKIYLDEAFAIKNNSRRHRVNDIITVHTGDVGTSAIIEEELDGSLGFATIVTRIHDFSIISPKYLCHYLNSNACKQQIAGMTKGDRNNLNLKDFNKLIIPVPDIDVQNRIVQLLDDMEEMNRQLTISLQEEIELRNLRYNISRDSIFQ